MLHVNMPYLIVTASSQQLTSVTIYRYSRRVLALESKVRHRGPYSSYTYITAVLLRLDRQLHILHSYTLTIFFALEFCTLYEDPPEHIRTRPYTTPRSTISSHLSHGQSKDMHIRISFFLLLYRKSIR